MSQTTWLTQDAYDRLAGELKQRKEIDRGAIAHRIDDARKEGDLKENGGYHAAREQQGLNEARIIQLEELLRDAEVGQTPPDDGIVEPGMVVEATIGREKTRFLLGTRAASDGLGIDVVSPDAPMGLALIGHKGGDTVSFKSPSGKIIKVKIGQVKPYHAE